jgi:hypothetical protein
MRRTVLLIFIIQCFSSVSYGQTGSAPQRRPTYLERLEAHDKRSTKQAELGGLYGSGVTSSGSRPGNAEFESYAKAALLKLPKSTANLTPYQEVLKERHSGVIRLLKANECQKEQSVSFVIDSTCPQMLLPSRGAFISFRQQQYSYAALSDLGFINGDFVSYGLLNQGILTDLGDVDFNSIDISHKTVRDLYGIEVAETSDKVLRQAAAFESGVRVGNNFFKFVMPVKLNSVYLARFIAYRGHVYRELETAENRGNRPKLDILAGDDRKDILVVFKVLALESDGSVTIIWKRLQAVKSPKLKD